MNFFPVFFSVFFLSFTKLNYFMLQNWIISCYKTELFHVTVSGNPNSYWTYYSCWKQLHLFFCYHFSVFNFVVFASSSWSSYLFIEFIIIIINSWNLHYFIMKCYAMNIFTIAWSNSFINLNLKNRWFSHSHCTDVFYSVYHISTSATK